METVFILLTIAVFCGSLYYNWQKVQRAELEKKRAETKKRIDAMKREIEDAQKETQDAKSKYNVVYDAYQRKYVVTERGPGDGSK